MIKKLIVLLVFFTTVHAAIWAQCGGTNTTFVSGEWLFYHASYNWGFIWLDAGTADFNVKTVNQQGVLKYHFKSSGRSYPEYDWFFMVRDTFESYVNTANLLPEYYRRRTSEAGYKVWNDFSFDWERKLIYTKSANSDKPMVQDTFPNTDCYLDVLSSIYYFRNLDFDSMKPDQKVSLNMIVDNELFPGLYARYLGVDTLKMRDGTRYSCHVLKPSLVEGTMFKGGERMTVWITNDQNRLPVMIEAEVLVGKVKAYLMEYKNLRHPMQARIEDR